MKLYVWRGPTVLRNYVSGMVVVAASSAILAWEKLEANDFHTWFELKTGIKHVYERYEVEYLEAWQEDETYIAPEPEEYTLETFPVLVIQGGE